MYAARLRAWRPRGSSILLAVTVSSPIEAKCNAKRGRRWTTAPAYIPGLHTLPSGQMCRDHGQILAQAMDRRAGMFRIQPTNHGVCLDGVAARRSQWERVGGSVALSACLAAGSFSSCACTSRTLTLTHFRATLSVFFSTLSLSLSLSHLVPASRHSGNTEGILAETTTDYPWQLV